jgi:hypothetical protein
MTWEDLEKARAEHAAKEAKKTETKAKRAAKKAAKEAKSVEEATVGKTQRGRKRKSATEGDARAKVARTGEEQYRAPVAKMY